ncbi:MAG TPA: hypothetical protein VK181_04420 [Rhizobium sp.]|nr:hypothetical protein [Rhizobium sp.]
MARSDVKWVAGPIRYRTSDSIEDSGRVIQAIKWEFVGGTDYWRLCRWNLIFNVSTRKFSSTDLDVSGWETEHGEAIAKLYRPVAILGNDLPRGNRTTILKSMLSQADITEAVAIAINPLRE